MSLYMLIITLLACGTALISGQGQSRVFHVSPPRPPCGPVCAIFCQFGNVLDSRGCPTCQCRQDPRRRRCPDWSQATRRRCSYFFRYCGFNAYCNVASGHCCRRQWLPPPNPGPPNVSCPPGSFSTGRPCSAMIVNNNECGSYAFCQGGPADGGVCCWSTFPRRGQCPRSTGFGPCIFRPGINCLSDAECSSAQRCCPDGCGRICKNVFLAIG